MPSTFCPPPSPCGLSRDPSGSRPTRWMSCFEASPSSAASCPRGAATMGPWSNDSAPCRALGFLDKAEEPWAPMRAPSKAGVSVRNGASRKKILRLRARERRTRRREGYGCPWFVVNVSFSGSLEVVTSTVRSRPAAKSCQTTVRAGRRGANRNTRLSSEPTGASSPLCRWERSARCINPRTRPGF